MGIMSISRVAKTPVGWTTWTISRPSEVYTALERHCWVPTAHDGSRTALTSGVTGVTVPQSSMTEESSGSSIWQVIFTVKVPSTQFLWMPLHNNSYLYMKSESWRSMLPSESIISLQQGDFSDHTTHKKQYGCYLCVPRDQDHNIPDERKNGQSCKRFALTIICGQQYHFAHFAYFSASATIDSMTYQGWPYFQLWSFELMIIACDLLVTFGSLLIPGFSCL